MRISDVLASLRAEFPAVTHSKLRFLEEQGLVDPLRTPSGYRQYSPADVERLRFVLTEQRDRYLPLKVIKEKLAAMDSGAEEVVVAPRLVGAVGAPAGVTGPRSTSRLSATDLADRGKVDPKIIEDLTAAGLIRADARGFYEQCAVKVVELVASLGEHGIEARHLRALRTSVDRDLSLINQVIAPLRGQRSPSARARAGAVGAELGETITQLHAALLRQGVADLAL